MHNIYHTETMQCYHALHSLHASNILLIWVRLGLSENWGETENTDITLRRKSFPPSNLPQLACNFTIFWQTCIIFLLAASGSFTGPQNCGGVWWGGVGWGNNVHLLAHFYDVTPRYVHLHLRTYVMLRWRCLTSCRGWGGVGLCWRMEYQIPLRAQLVVSPTKSCGRTWEVSSGVGNVMTKASWPKLDKPWRRSERRKRRVSIRLVLRHKTL